tara:strand:- start:435 stop:1682 length:1248 start_codon:yes stop_codon:yes gene_type:complete
MKTKTLNKLIKDYAKTFENLGFKLNPNFKKDFLHIKRMKTNGTKISFIKADKIKGLKENIKGFKLKPNDTEQREKYFTAVKPSKFLSSFIIEDRNNTLQNSLFCNISEQFNKDFISNLKSKLVLFSGDDISRIYNEASVVGCMSRSCKSWFKVYDKTENLQLATLTDEAETILMRSLLWYDKETNNYWLDNSYEQSSINGDNEIRQDYQKKLICQVLEHIKESKIHSLKGTNLDFGFGCRFANSLDSRVMKELQEKFNVEIFRDVKRKIITETHTDLEGKETERETERSKERILLKPIILDFDADNFESFPYSDTFQSIGRNSGKWFLNDNSGDTDFVCCRSTEGEDENNSGQNCDCCDSRITDEDYIHYSEVEEEYLCDDCSTYIEEREDTCRSDNAIYNNHTGDYHYCNDLDN